MEQIIGIRLIAEPTGEQTARCSEISSLIMKTLMAKHKITYNQILYPYADALSLSGKPGTESTRVFGTHMLLRNVPEEWLTEALAECACDIPCELMQFPLTEGAAMSDDIQAFLQSGEAAGSEANLPQVGEFGRMLSGYVPHWRIRECSRVFASFCEMAYRRAHGKIAGLSGGSLLLFPFSDPSVVGAIFTEKTGLR